MSRGYPVTLSTHWIKSGSAIASNRHLTVIEEREGVGALLFHNIVMFASLDRTREEDGDYTCVATVSSPNGDEVTVTATQSVVIESKCLLSRELLQSGTSE